MGRFSRSVTVPLSIPHCDTRPCLTGSAHRSIGIVTNPPDEPALKCISANERCKIEAGAIFHADRSARAEPSATRSISVLGRHLIGIES
jgi:hypothetical protein